MIYVCWACEPLPTIARCFQMVSPQKSPQECLHFFRNRAGAHRHTLVSSASPLRDIGCVIVSLECQMGCMKKPHVSDSIVLDNVQHLRAVNPSVAAVRRCDRRILQSSSAVK